MNEVMSKALTKRNITINALVTQIGAISKEKGWHSDPALQSPEKYLSDVRSEIRELSSELRRYAPAALLLGRNGKPEGPISEGADIIIRTLDFFAYHRAPIVQAIMHKVDYNSRRPYHHGKDVREWLRR